MSQTPALSSRERGSRPSWSWASAGILELDAIDNIYLLGTLMGLSLHELRRSVDEILEFAELRPFARMHLKHYSSGMAARLAYSVAFRAVRDVLILDEILAVGDAGFESGARSAIASCARRATAPSSSATIPSSCRASATGHCCSRKVVL